MTIKCLLVDDEPPAIELLENYIAMFSDLEVLHTCSNALQALEFLKRHSVDLLFLDIEMPGLSGFEFLKALQNPPKVIITTAYRDYATEGYDLDIVDYLLKPISLQRFAKAIDRYYNRTNLPVLNPTNSKSFIYVNVNKKNTKINYQDILFVESLKDYTRFHLQDKKLIIKGNIGKFEKLLPQEFFIRVHRSYIVSIQKITAFTQHDIEIENIEIPLGKSYQQTVLNKLKGEVVEWSRAT